MIIHGTRRVLCACKRRRQLCAIDFPTASHHDLCFREVQRGILSCLICQVTHTSKALDTRAWRPEGKLDSELVLHFGGASPTVELARQGERKRLPPCLLCGNQVRVRKLTYVHGKRGADGRRDGQQPALSS